MIPAIHCIGGRGEGRGGEERKGAIESYITQTGRVVSGLDRAGLSVGPFVYKYLE
jgi:hypothetical protein